MTFWREIACDIMIVARNMSHVYSARMYSLFFVVLALCSDTKKRRVVAKYSYLQFTLGERVPENTVARFEPQNLSIRRRGPCWLLSSAANVFFQELCHILLLFFIFHFRHSSQLVEVQTCIQLSVKRAVTSDLWPASALFMFPRASLKSTVTCIPFINYGREWTCQEGKVEGFFESLRDSNELHNTVVSENVTTETERANSKSFLIIFMAFDIWTKLHCSFETVLHTTFFLLPQAYIKRSVVSKVLYF